MQINQTPPLSFDQFQSILAKELMLPKDQLTKDASLIDDLQVDSLAMVSMMLRFEENGITIPIERAWDMQTIGDIYQAYLELLGNNLEGEI